MDSVFGASSFHDVFRRFTSNPVYMGIAIAAVVLLVIVILQMGRAGGRGGRR
jgi:hypothetical protein